MTLPGGLVVDPFSGSGSTLQAAVDEGFRAPGFERESDYVRDIRRRFGVLPVYAGTVETVCLLEAANDPEFGDDFRRELAEELGVRLAA